MGGEKLGNRERNTLPFNKWWRDLKDTAMWNKEQHRKVQKYGYNENRNKKMVALTDE
jgi:hypothetical protein